MLSAVNDGNNMKIHLIIVFILLLNYMCIPKCVARLQVSLRLMTPILKTRYYVLCDVQISSGVEDNVYFKFPVYIKDNNLECQVNDWRKCDTRRPPYSKRACGCYNKKHIDTGVIWYQFYLLIDPVTEIFAKSNFTCELHSVKDTRQMEVAMFTRTPERTLYACMNTTILLDWEFKIISDIIENRFDVAQIAWTALDQVRHRTIGLGTYVYSAIGHHSFTNDDHNTSILNTESTSLPQLSLLTSYLEDSKYTISINVTFNMTSMSPELQQFEGMLITSAYKETVLDKQERHMIDEVLLIVTVPPPRDTKLTVTAYASVTGNMVIRCEVPITFPGEPPINVTLWQEDVRLVTKTNVNKLLHYSTHQLGRNISCSLEGHAIDCLPEDDNRRQKVMVEFKDAQQTSNAAPGKFDFVSLYAWESLICILLMLWTLSLLIEHIHLKMKRSSKIKLKSRKKEIVDT